MGHTTFRLSIGAWALFVASRFTATAAEEPRPATLVATTAVDQYVTAKIASSHIPGLALAIVENDRVIQLKGYGRADTSGRPVTPQTPFMIGSITKPFTALAVMQLVEAGMVDLDAPVQRYIQWFRVADPMASRAITVRHLLTMTSGIPQLYATQRWTDQDAGVLERTVRYLERVELVRPVGAFGYSNANYDTLGLIVQDVSGLSYEDYVRQRIFTPLAMRDSFLSQGEARQHGMASGHRWWFGVPIAVTLPFVRAELPAGYILSGAQDMSHFLIAQLNGGRYGRVSILSPDGIRLTHTATTAGRYGFGWEVLRDHGRTLVGHVGGTPNFQSSVVLDPEARIGVFIAANVMNGLDAFSSPHVAGPLDGPTVRAMATTVLSLVSGRPLPNQGIGHERLTVMANVAVLALSLGLGLSLRRGRAARRRRAGRAAVPSTVVRRLGRTALLYFTLPVIVSSLALFAPGWGVYAAFQPDLVYWLYAVTAILLVTGVVEMRSIVSVRDHPDLRSHS